MARPQLQVEIDFGNGPSFGYPLILDSIAYGVLGTNILADNPVDVADITDMVMKVSTRRGRNRILANFEAGTATVVLNDPNSWFSPSNTESPYYGKLVPLRKIRIYALYDIPGTPGNSVIFSGYITSYDTNFYQGTNETSTVTLQCVDGFRLLNNVGVNVVPGAVAGQTSGERVQILLNEANFPSSMTDIDLGDSTMQADPGGQRALLAAIQTIEQSEFGAFYMDPNGRANFLSRSHLSKLADLPPYIYTDTNVENDYTSIDFSYDDQLILNDVTVTRLGGVPQEVTDPESINTYFIKSGQRSDILVQTDQEANDQARTLLAARAQANLRIDSMTLNLTNPTDDQLLSALRTDIYTLVNITKSMPNQIEPVTRELFVQGINHDIKFNSWVTTFFTAEPIIQAFILDSTNQGILRDEFIPVEAQNNNALSY
jgi:hypothetical protein